MQRSEFLNDIAKRLEDQIKRGRSAGHAMTPEQLNWVPEKRWSAAQIYEHMMLGNAPYLQLVQQAIGAAPKGADREVEHTFVGKLILKAAGPDGNAPPPKQMIPKPGPYTPDIIDRWAAQTQAFLDLVRSSQGIDLTSTRVRNPFFRFLSMNLADSYMILTEHTERHVRQIEAIRDRK